jgi:DNA-binding transcriptional ArsR family regulator
VADGARLRGAVPCARGGSARAARGAPAHAARARDDTRLRILKLIAERPRTTQELGPLVGLSTAGLSKSLRRLAEAGLVAPRREGYYVVYSLDPARIAALSPAIEGFLEDAQGDSEPARR